VRSPEVGGGCGLPRAVSVCERKVEGLWVQSGRLLHASSLQTSAGDATNSYICVT